MRNEFKDLTVVICSYKANKEFKLCLHQLARYGFTKENLLIFENSPMDYKSNREMLNEYKIAYINNPGGLHADSMNTALEKVNTKYALLLDSDCFCVSDPARFISFVKSKNIQLYGDICGDRGGYHIHKRVHPWYCYVDVEFLKQHNIKFVDFERIKASGSESFVKTDLLNSPRDPKGFYYDAGSTMYEDVIAAGGICVDIGDNKPYLHVEGASWRRNFKQWESTVVGQDNWVRMLYEKLQFGEKYLSLLGASNKPQERKDTKKN